MGRLPPELLFQIFGYADNASNKRDLRACALVCRAWRAPAQAVFFHTVTLPAQNGWFLLSLVLRRCPHIRPMIREVIVTCHYASSRYRNLPAQLPRLITATFTNGTVPDLRFVSQISTLRRLRLQSDDDEPTSSVEELKELVKPYPCALTEVDINMRGHAVQKALFHWLGRTSTDGSDSLKHVGLEYAEALQRATIVKFLDTYRSLRSLTLYMRASEYPGIPDFGTVPVQMLRVVTPADRDSVERVFGLLRYTQFPKLTVLRVELSIPWRDGCRRAHRQFDISPFHYPDLDHRDWTLSPKLAAQLEHLYVTLFGSLAQYNWPLYGWQRLLRLFGDARARVVLDVKLNVTDTVL